MALQKSTHKVTRIQVETGDIPKKPLQREATVPKGFLIALGTELHPQASAFWKAVQIDIVR